MLRKLVELIPLAVAVGLTLEVIKSAVPYLPVIWLLLIGYYMWDFVSSNSALALAARAKVRLSRKMLMVSYFVVAIAGAAFFVVCWWGLTSFFAPRIAVYEAEQQEKKKQPEE